MPKLVEICPVIWEKKIEAVKSLPSDRRTKGDQKSSLGFSVQVGKNFTQYVARDINKYFISS